MLQLPCYNSQHFFLRGECLNCGLFGHKAAQCKNPKGKELPGAGGAMKKAGAGGGSGVEPPPKMTMAAKQIRTN